MRGASRGSVSQTVRKITQFLAPARSVLTLAGILLAGCTSLWAQLDFAARRDLAIGATPHGVAIADLNADGKKDIVAANGSSNSFSILLGAGGGVFKPEVRKTTAAFPNGLVVASFNSNTDALLDVAVACFVGDQVQFFPGNGAGGFGSATSFSTGVGSHPIALAVLDYNLDNKNDLAVVLNGSNTVRLYQGNGLGGFSLVSTLPVDLSPVDLVLGDWDGDFKLDLAVVSELDTSPIPPPDGKVTVAYGCPTGFCFPTVFTAGPIPASITFGLLNSDPYPDLVVGSTSSNNLAVLFGDPDFGFTAVQSVPVGGFSQVVWVADLNGDSKQDLSVGLELAQGQGALQVLTGDGFGAFTAGAIFPVGSFPGGIAGQDIGGTAALDLVTTNVGAGSLSLLFGNGAAGFTSTPSYLIAAGASISALDSADMNADGKIDLAVTRTDENHVDVLVGSGTGTFSAGATLILPGNQPGDASATDVLVRNFTSDSLLDIVAMNGALETISVFPGTGPGTFGSRVDYGLGNSCNQSSGAGCVNPEGLADGPLNDTDTTHPDLIVANSAGDGAFPYGSISVFLQSGGGFGSATRFTGGGSPTCTGGVAFGLPCTTNANCSGRCSIATATPCNFDTDCPTGQTCSNPGPGTCTIAPSGAAVGLVNADTNRDVVVCEYALARSAYLAGNGTGAFPTASGTVTTGVGPRTPLLKDLDGDGDQDLVTLNFDDSSVSTFLGDNAGGFAPVVQVMGVRSPWKGALADLNQDGWDDLIVAGITAGSVQALLGDGTGRFGVPVRFGTGAIPRDLTVADLNADGKPDVAVTNELDGTVSILLNSSQSPILNITQAAGGTQASWSAFFEASSYDLIRGDRAQITQTATQVSLGTVVCIENDSPNTDNVGNEDNVTPPLGTTYFYLFRTQDALVKGSYGRSTLGKVRVAASGDCL